jgi:signal transduction histidine kinase
MDKGNHISEFRTDDLDTKSPVLLFSDEEHEVYWLGVPENANIYLIKSAEEALVVDPGIQACFIEARDRVKQILDPVKVSGIIINHQNPDVATSITQWSQVNPQMMVVTSPRINALLPCYGVDGYSWHNVVDEPVFTFSSGKRIRFIEAPYLHFAGAFTSFDEASGFLFSGDIWAAIQLKWQLIVTDFDAHKPVLDLFHRDHMSSNIACRGYIERISNLQINAILPKHGSIIDSAFVGSALHYLESLMCGTDIIYPHLSGFGKNDKTLKFAEFEQQTSLLAGSSRQNNHLVRKGFLDALMMLKQRDHEFNQRKRKLEKDLEMLKVMRQELVEKKKMAALGALVSGVAHEVNTAIGIVMTSITSCDEEIKTIKYLYETDELSEQDLERFFDLASESMLISLKSLNQAARLINSFKKISVDQNIDDKRKINVKEYLQDIIRTFHSQLKKSKIEVKLECAGGLIIETYPGLLSQIINNLISNVISHAYGPDEQGVIYIRVFFDGGFLQIIFADLGKGMDSAIKTRIFQPFTTTARNQGGSGLGLHIVYKLVTQRFGGEIHYESDSGKGTRFFIKLATHLLGQ